MVSRALDKLILYFLDWSIDLIVVSEQSQNSLIRSTDVFIIAEIAKKRSLSSASGRWLTCNAFAKLAMSAKVQLFLRGLFSAEAGLILLGDKEEDGASFPNLPPTQLPSDRRDRFLRRANDAARIAAASRVSRERGAVLAITRPWGYSRSRDPPDRD